MKQSIRLTAAFAALFACATMAGEARAIDISPGDYTYLPAGTNIGLAYLTYQSASSFRDKAGNSFPDSKGEAAIGIARLVHYGETAGVGWGLQAFVPFGAISQARIGGADLAKADGLGDLVLGATLFPIHSADPTGTTIGITGYLGLPTGNYSPTKASVGSGAFTFTPQLGINQGLGNGFFLDVALDGSFYGDHTNDGISVKQDPTLQTQAYLRYAVSKATSVSFGYSGTFGGQIYFNGIAGLTKTREDQLRLFANTFVTQTLQVQGMIGTDVSATGGFKNAIVTQIRILKIF